MFLNSCRQRDVLGYNSGDYDYCCLERCNAVKIGISLHSASSRFLRNIGLFLPHHKGPSTLVTEHRTEQGCVRPYRTEHRNMWRTQSCKLYTLGFPVRYGSPTDVFAASSSFVHLHALRIEEWKETAAVVTNAIAQKQGSLQWFKFIKRLEFSASQWPV